MTSSEKKTEGPTSFSASRRTAWKSPFLPPASQMVDLVVGVFDLDDRPVDQHADRDGDAGELMMLTVTPM